MIQSINMHNTTHPLSKPKQPCPIFGSELVVEINQPAYTCILNQVHFLRTTPTASTTQPKASCHGLYANFKCICQYTFYLHNHDRLVLRHFCHRQRLHGLAQISDEIVFSTSKKVLALFFSGRSPSLVVGLDFGMVKEIGFACI